MEKFVLCALLHAGMHKVCWVVQTTTQCAVELDDWTTRALRWKRQSGLRGPVVGACWRSPDERDPTPRRTRLTEPQG